MKDHCIQPAAINEVYLPVFFRLQQPSDKQAFVNLLQYDPSIRVNDDIEGQLKELVKSLHPSIKIKPEAYPALIREHVQGQDFYGYGVWVYYPWSKQMVHLLDEAEFVEVRTNRNRYKITQDEQARLNRKKVGVIGLSVGQSIALTMAIERTCGELRLADFDTVELSNLNRIRTGVHNLGLKKTVIAAREIAEIDPFLNVKIFNDGIHQENIDAFFTADGMLDLLVEVCDGLDVKILSRFKARELKVPVVMDTNDRGMLDVERFDLEPERPILHGLAGDLDPHKIKNLTNEEKIPYILTMIGAEAISPRLKASMLEVEQSINTWPQLASSVALGGAITTDVCRNIFLDRFHDSGRYYLDVDDIIKDKVPELEAVDTSKFEGPSELGVSDLQQIAGKYHSAGTGKSIRPEQLNQILEAACLAPSGGNAQPWKFLYEHNELYIIHDAYYSFSLLDFNNLGSYIAFGAMLENIELKAASLGLTVHQRVFPVQDDLRLVAVLSFEESRVENPFTYLAGAIGTRVTNRNISERKPLKEGDRTAIVDIATTIPGVHLDLFDQEESIKELAEIITNAERLRFMHPRGHYDTFIKELRFSQEEAEATQDGMDVRTLNMTESEMAALRIAKDPSAVAFLHRMHKGTGFKKISSKNVLTASSIGVVLGNGHEAEHYVQAGRAVERIWLEANHRSISLQPVSQVIFMNEIFLSQTGYDFNGYELEELKKINERLTRVCNLSPGSYPLFMFRLCYADVPQLRSLRKPVEDMLFSIS